MPRLRAITHFGVQARRCAPRNDVCGGVTFIQPPYHVIINVEMREFIKITAFILIIVGTAGLLLNEFVLDASTALTLTFAGVNVIGLICLAIAHYTKQSKNAS